MQIRIWIIAPCYYDVPSFLELKRHTQSVIAENFKDAELINVLIDDSGGQDTAIKTLEQEQGLVIVSPPFNLGHQSALVFALRGLSTMFRDSDLIITMDSDGEDRPEDIPALVAPLLGSEQNLSLVSIAQRTKRQRDISFKVMYFFFRIFFLTLTGTVVHNGNFMAYRGWIAKNVIFHPFFDYCYSSSVLTLAKALTYVPLARGSRYFGTSKMTLISLISHGFRMLLPFSDRIAVRAVVAATLLSILATVAAAYSAYLVFHHSPKSILAIGVTITALCVLAVVMGTAALLFNIFNQTMAIALRQLTLHQTPLDCMQLYGLKLDDLQR
jgi:polyisoprenyl-phosphate glycosyltransferase